MTPPAAATGRTRLIVLTALALALLGFRLVQTRVEHARVAARQGALLGDLRRLAVAQDGYYARHGEFAPALDAPDLGFAPSADRLLRYERVAPDAWQAVVTDPMLAVPPTRCGIFEGTLAASPHRSLLEPSVPGCW